MNKEKQKPLLVVLSAPSGGGKTTVCKKLATENPEYRISISATTRPPRSTEKDGVDYHFLSEKDFFKKVEEGQFLEFEEVHGNYYGTLKKNVQNLLDAGFTVLFDMDVYGAMSIKKHYPESILIFIRPPSMEELQRRLKNRKTDDESEIERRLKRLPVEYSKAEYFDYDIINHHLHETVDKIKRIILKHQNRETDVSNKSI
jgi:guanylate kinase